ncbi:tyrosine-protein phosphatase [Sphingobium sp. AN641]|uniref:tyrosine-protein phosphatase n=1 Tax=Sphingobium sp. AN641 TaxID=3133443 RepID=UPI0030BCBCFB
MTTAGPPGSRVPLERGFNLRDFGGYATADGRTVKRGMLYRSGTMALLSPADAAHLRSLGIRAICDFRRREERAAEPTEWHEDGVDYYCRDYDETSGVLAEMIRTDGASAADMRAVMVGLYRVIAADHAESYRAMFAQILDGRLPILINCAAGKDRTGVGAALILAVLGVPRETIVEDYLLTNVHADWDWRLAQDNSAIARAHRSRGAAIAPVLTADRAYIETLFETLDTAHGGMDGYIADVLGVDDGARAAIQAMLLD